MKHSTSLFIFACSIAVALARPEAPKTRYGPPPVPRDQYGHPPPVVLQKDYLPPPPAPQTEYLPPALTASQEFRPSTQLQTVYGAPATFYGPPAVETALVTKNVYVHVPPEEPTVYHTVAPIRTTVPKKHYKIIFIKAPSPPAPVNQVLPPPVQDEHKTLVYVLVKKPEEQQPLVLPSPAPTEPSKPEVYFIKYKQRQQPATRYGPPPPPAPTAPASEYGPPPPETVVENF